MSQREETRIAYRRQTRAALRYIREYVAGGLTLRDLAEAACSSPYHFHRVFRRMTGVAVEAHLREFALVRAAMDLRTTDLSVGIIAARANYANQESFSRAFRRRFQSSPSHYRASQLMSTFELRIGHIKVPVSNFEASRTFYRDVIGLEEEFAVEAYGWAQYKTGNIPFCLFIPGLGGGEAAFGGERDFSLHVSDCQALRDRVQSANADAIAQDIVESDDGGRFFMVRDPDGNLFKVIQFVE